ncbi:TonB-dependent receptor domain-containing protein [Marinicaulis aureus]|uniref:TonB-dependent receptor domain-containing protein n=1 Tax=Hyphococcus aureus TaxID=2666033 RepID=A0ABW1KXK6_9PROT
MKKNMRNAIAASVSAMALICVAEAASSDAGFERADNSVALEWNIPAQSLTDALIAWSEQSNFVVLIEDDLTAGIRSRELIGAFTSFEALERLLAASGLTYKIRDEQTLIVSPRLQTASMTVPADVNNAAGMRDSQRVEIGRERDDPEQSGRRSDSERSSADRDQIVVTGTRIRGASPAAPIQTITRQEIERSGQSQTGELLRTLPQTFRGGINPTVQPTTVNTNSGLGGDSTVNLRGMGPDATLILVNGRRLAPIGGGETTDVSAIPLAALDRVDVLLDGSSALYGADAVAGVVNFIVADDYDGAELRARVGGATQGGGFEQTYSAAAGERWKGGSFLVGADYLKQNPIFAGERDFSETAGPLNSLLPANRQWSGFMSGNQELSSFVELDVIGLYTNRRASRTTEYGAGGFADSKTVDTESFLIAPRATVELPAGWTAQIEGSAARSTRDIETTDNFGGDFDAVSTNTAWTIGAATEGKIARLPSGDLRAAIGGGYREEALDADLGGTLRNGTRNIAFFFGEASAPLVSPSEDRLGLARLELNVAVRVEDHSGFGAATTPKAGVRYAPIPDIVFRGTWGKSFRAPRFDHLLADHVVTLWNAPNLGSADPGLAFLNFSGNPDLEPERATSWTAGFDWTPQFIPAFDLSVTYFDIDFRDRIVSPIVNLGSALSDPAHEPFVDRDPSASAQSAIIDAADQFFNISGLPYDPNAVLAIVNSGFVNASSQQVRGTDVSFRFAPGDVAFFGDFSWLRIDTQTIPTFAVSRQSGLIFQPAEFRGRGGASWEIDDSFTATAIVNYVSGSKDNVAMPAAEVSSWTTLDLTLQYRLGSLTNALDGFEASLSVTNAFDEDPPFAAGGGVAFPGMLFDSANASPVGRFIAATLRYSL